MDLFMIFLEKVIGNEKKNLFNGFSMIDNIVSV